MTNLPHNTFPYLQNSAESIESRIGIGKEELKELQGDDSTTFLNSPFSNNDENMRVHGCLTAWDVGTTPEFKCKDGNDPRAITILLFNLKEDFIVHRHGDACLFTFSDQEFMYWELDENAHKHFAGVASEAFTYGNSFRGMDTEKLNLLGTNIPVYMTEVKTPLHSSPSIQETEHDGKFYYYAYPSQIKFD